MSINVRMECVFLMNSFLMEEFDCLDWSDEMPFKKSEECPAESVSMDCDDHLCPPAEWSCGDGECISNRLDFQKWSFTTCQSRRDQYYICETSIGKRQWTMLNGRCVELDDRGGRYQESSAANGSEVDQCEYFLKCSLSEGGEKDCPCSRGCVEKLAEVCSSPMVAYPRRAIVAPFLFFLFNRTKDWDSKVPDALLINGTVRCQDSLVTVTKIIPFERYFYVHTIIQTYFCHSWQTISWSENISILV